MREVTLSKTGSLKTRTLCAEFFLSDIETSVKSFAPGEWVRFINPKRKEAFIGFINPMVEANSPCGYAIKTLAGKSSEEPWDLIESLIADAVEKRTLISDYGMSARMIFGTSDLLPGLIVDSFENCALVQINTAGLDGYREKIKTKLSEILEREVFLLDNPAYRMSEGLPVFERDWSIETLNIKESGLSYVMPADNLQKVGFYFDHRENRNKLRAYLERLSKRKLSKGLDLFCYAGAWGMTMAKAGVDSVEFVDQGNFKETVSRNWKLNGLDGESVFERKNVFDFLKEKQKVTEENELYDVVVSDPPAFCKSQKGAQKALEGYLKLHRGCFRILKDKSFLAACSCTRYVDLNEFIQNVNMAARQEGRRLTMLDIGTQGFDHPSYGFKDKSNYLKYVLFYAEKL